MEKIKYLTLLKTCNLPIEMFENGEISSVIINQQNKSIIINVNFPTPLSIGDIDLFLTSVPKVFANFGCRVNFNITYTNKDIEENLLEQYLSAAVDRLGKNNQMIKTFTNYSYMIKNNVITYKCADELEQNNIEKEFKDFNMFFKFYGLNVEMSTMISDFEVSLVDKYNLKMEMARRQHESDEIEKAKINAIKNQVDRVEFNPSKKNISVSQEKIEDLPVTQMDVTEFKQSRGTDKVIVKGVLISFENRVIIGKKDGRKYNIFSGVITDYKDSISIQRFFRNEDRDFYEKEIKTGDEIEVNGSIAWNDFSADVCINVDRITILGKDTILVKFDEAPEKRVELHAHTKMSPQDSVLDVEAYVKQAKAFGHKAIAVTDHNNCQVLPDLFKACKKAGVKPIAGFEGSLIDENRFKIALTDDFRDLKHTKFVVFDIETTGLRNNYDDIIEIGAVKVENGVSIDTFSSFVKPNKPINEIIENITHISNDDVRLAPNIKDCLVKFVDFIGDSILVAHNANFDFDFIKRKLKENNLEVPNFLCIDTLQLARSLYPDLSYFSLEKVAKHLHCTIETQHRALSDSQTTVNIFNVMLNEIFDHGVYDYHEINNLINDDAYKHIIPRHVTMLVKNKVGLKNLYKIITDAQTMHFHKEPRVLKSFLSEHREGLFIGTSCSDGEIFRLAYEKSYEDVLKAIDFYDYVEIQPLENYRYLVDLSGEKETENYIKGTINKIIKAANEKGKIIVATGDVHQLNDEDVELRNIYVNSKSLGGGIHPLCSDLIKNIPSQPFYTTNEMLDNFKYLGDDKAYEYVIKNTNLIADQIEEFDLFKEKELYVPHDDFLAKYGIPSMEQGLKEMVFTNAKALYGDPLPQYVYDRCEFETEALIKHGFCSVYFISHMLVKKSVDDGYIVGSRGSVGSSFVATMMNITEVNPLKPHYRCPHCRFTAFQFKSKEDKEKYNQNISEEMEQNLQEVNIGFDLKPMKCPHCGCELERDGNNIEFATFMGINGEKTPDIDLNFSNEYQAKAHLFVREMFGYDYSFRAGTIMDVAEKTAFGYVKGYMERKNVNLRKAEINRIANRIAGSKRTTGQHPGGIVVLPDYLDYTDVFPVQYPSEDITKEWRTTHYDYHKFEDNLLKLDILGHDDPTMIKTLMDYVHNNQEDFKFSKVEEIPFLDPLNLELFSSKRPLGLNDNDVDDLPSGTIGLPEFGTNLARRMLADIKPKNFSDIIKTSGLSHGTGVWEGNSKDLVLGKSEFYKGSLTMDDVICCRDDIMTYLSDAINMPKEDAFKIMEQVRKNKGHLKPLKPEQIELMRNYKVPEWYIESCKIIEYLFPKAHATAYCLMCLRIAWFKIYKPIYYYAAYFSKRADEFDVEVFTEGKNAIKNKMKEIENKGKQAENKETALYDELKIALEMVSRGFKFLPIDINISGGTEFVISPEKNALYMPFSSVNALGSAAANSVVEARSHMPFTSIDDVQNRTKLNKTQLAKLKVLGAFGNLPEHDTHQLF